MNRTKSLRAALSGGMGLGPNVAVSRLLNEATNIYMPPLALPETLRYDSFIESAAGESK